MAGREHHSPAQQALWRAAAAVAAVRASAAAAAAAAAGRRRRGVAAAGGAPELCRCAGAPLAGGRPRDLCCAFEGPQPAAEGRNFPAPQPSAEAFGGKAAAAAAAAAGAAAPRASHCLLFLAPHSSHTSWMAARSSFPRDCVAASPLRGNWLSMRSRHLYRPSQSLASEQKPALPRLAAKAACYSSARTLNGARFFTLLVVSIRGRGGSGCRFWPAFQDRFSSLPCVGTSLRAFAYRQ